ncbi:ATP-binding cassette domain-containing protein [Hespellia stercorisuis]|uniref:Autoinducer 2 import ATP-binding protein LsrA n=1 Tax=Hespellia stercorisuis DSM 15480 TaxID=1121950 RepID=A0A1M6RCQ7_9FIRM|nr:ATP-binding cassette domain-containing protein [Hespellia stercorisuis]SHK30249.1 ribose transport system ATP-binding protein [Hespellia stercorisuis DSM 15480]
MKQFSFTTKDLSKISDRPLINDINFSAYSGEIHAIIGNNGEGKTVFAQVLAGIRSKTAGEILIDGKPALYSDICSAQRLGIYMIQQEIQLFPDLRVWENLISGNEERLWGKHIFAPSRKRILQYCRDVLEDLDIPMDLHAFVTSLHEADQRLLQLARVLICKPKILILDEFSTFLNSRETEHIYALLERLKEQNTLIILITHKYSEIPRYCDRVSVINDGTITGTFSKREFGSDNFFDHISCMNLEYKYPRIDMDPGEELLHVSAPVCSSLRNLDFHLYRRSIIGIAGLTIPQKAELYTYISQKLPGTSLIPQKTAESTLFLNQSLPFNIAVSNFGKMLEHGFISDWKCNAYAKSYLHKLGFHNVDIHTRPRHLSSGNQQKLLIARSLLCDASLYYYDDPTRTLDATSRLELYNILNALALKGASIVLLSTNYSELIGICSRIVLFKDGEQIGNYAADYLSSEVIYKNI